MKTIWCYSFTFIKYKGATQIHTCIDRDLCAVAFYLFSYLFIFDKCLDVVYKRNHKQSILFFTYWHENRDLTEIDSDASSSVLSED